MTISAALDTQPTSGIAPAPESHRSPIEEQTRRLQREFLIMLRANATVPARSVHGLPASLRASNRPGLSQEAVAEAMNISSRAYRSLEAGGNWSEDLVRAFERAVGLDRDGEQAASTRQVLWNLLIGRPPRACGTVITEVDRLHIDSQPAPTYLSNDWWEMVYRNRAMEHWFPALRPGTNIMTWAMSEAGAEQLLDWEECWLRPMLAQLRAAYYGSLNGNTHLAECLGHVLAEVLKSEVVRHYWERDRFRFHLGPNGNVRRLIHPDGRERTILLYSSQILNTPNTRLVHVYEMVDNEGVLQPAPAA